MIPITWVRSIPEAAIPNFSVSQIFEQYHDIKFFFHTFLNILNRPALELIKKNGLEGWSVL
jgi:hypothetical protein